MNDTLASDVDG